MNKKDLAKQLNGLADLETNPFKKRAYAKASRIIADMSEEEFKSRDNFTDIEGIGEAINKKILQFKKTGSIEKWRELFGRKSD
jgi:DNA polymerase/3'-5' exonuclease PolX